MKNFLLALLIICALGPECAEAAPKLYRDQYGVYYKEYVFTNNPKIGSGYVKHYIRRVVHINFEEEKVYGVATASPNSLKGPLGESPILTEAQRQEAITRAEKNGAVVDRSLGVSDYRFGEAGGVAAASAFAFGVAVEAATDAAQVQRIERLRQEVEALDQAIKAQAQAFNEEGANVAAVLAVSGQALDIALQGVSTLPQVRFADPGPSDSQEMRLFATQDPFFALRLNRLVARIESGRGQIPSDLSRVGLSAVKLADLEHAEGRPEAAESFISIAKTVADLALGLDPITGTVRGVYELVTGRNLVTNETLTAYERGLSLVNLATLGNFGTLQDASRAVSKLGHILDGKYLEAIREAIAASKRFFSDGVVNRLLSFRRAGEATVAEGTVLLNKTKPILLQFPSDEFFARILPREYAEGLTKGGARLSKEDVAFITAAEDLRGLKTRRAIAERLSLYESVSESRLKSMEDNVLVEFKFFRADDPLVSSPIGKPGSWGAGWIPGGLTRGGAREWIVDSKAVSNGLVNPATIQIRELPRH